jgi:hypothetical protein
MGIKRVFNDLSINFRTRLIGQGLGKKYFLQSHNPVVRATAFCARLNSETPLQAVADAILADCFAGDKIVEAAADIYRDHFLHKFRLNSHESDALASLLLSTPRFQEDLLYGLSVVNLVKHLGLS